MLIRIEFISFTAQGAHASVAAIAKSISSEYTKQYLNALESMHKVVLKAQNETDLVNLSDELSKANLLHHLWIEQPENIPACLATAPMPKDLISGYVKHLRLFK